MNSFDVVAAIIIKDNKYFIAQRNRNKHLGLKWEFPGGKVEKNETFENALKREIKEELNIDILIKNKLGEEKL
jgi:ADP-ribose pyrophosphatase